MRQVEVKRNISPKRPTTSGTYFGKGSPSLCITLNKYILNCIRSLHNEPHESRNIYTSSCLVAAAALVFILYLLLCAMFFYSMPETPQVRGLVKNINEHDRNAKKLMSSSELGEGPRNVSEVVKSFVKQVNSCTDVAPYFNMNTLQWGVFSMEKIRMEDAITFEGPFWIIVEFVMNQRGYPQPDCQEIEGLIHMKLPELLQHSGLGEYKGILPNKTMKVLIIDASDQGLHFHEYGYPLNECIRSVSDFLGPSNIYVAARALVEGRDLSEHMNFNTLFSQLNGTLLDYRRKRPRSKRKAFIEYVHNGVVAQWDFGIRPDYVSIFDEIVFMKLGKMGHWPVSFDDYFAFSRKGDVCHLWNIEPDDPYGKFRNMITRTVQDVINFYNFTGVTGLVSRREKIGRTSTSNAYAEALLDHKIVVVSQRDMWEGHYRLMEGLMSGAMIMSDPITFLPVGLADGENLVIYNSLNDLAEKIRYYLQDNQGMVERVRIAKAGKRVAMEQHQPHQRYERLVLGNNFPSDWRNPVAPIINCNI